MKKMSIERKEATEKLKKKKGFLFYHKITDIILKEERKHTAG